MDSNGVDPKLDYRKVNFMVKRIFMPILILCFRIVVIQRLDCCGQRFVNIQVHIGFFSAQKREENSLCTTFEGPSKTGAQDVMTCEETLEGTNVFFSKYEFVQSPPHPLNMEEIILIGSAA